MEGLYIVLKRCGHPAFGEPDEGVRALVNYTGGSRYSPASLAASLACANAGCCGVMRGNQKTFFRSIFECDTLRFYYIYLFYNKLHGIFFPGIYRILWEIYRYLQEIGLFAFPRCSCIHGRDSSAGGRRTRPGRHAQFWPGRARLPGDARGFAASAREAKTAPLRTGGKSVLSIPLRRAGKKPPPSLSTRHSTPWENLASFRIDSSLRGMNRFLAPGARYRNPGFQVVRQLRGIAQRSREDGKAAGRGIRTISGMRVCRPDWLVL